MELGNAGALGNGTNNTSGVTVSTGATLDLHGFTPTANVPLNLNGTGTAGSFGALTNISRSAVTYGGTVTLQSASSIGSNNSDITLSNTIGGAFGLTKAGGDTLILTGDSNGSDTTTISAGTLQIGNGGATGVLGSGAVTDNGNLTINHSNAFALSNAISGTGSLRPAAAQPRFPEQTLIGARPPLPAAPCKSARVAPPAR